MTDFALNVRQIFQYPVLPFIAGQKADLVVQYNTGAYYSIDAQSLVCNALSEGGKWLTIGAPQGIAFAHPAPGPGAVGGIFAEFAYDPDLQVVNLTGAPLMVPEFTCTDIGRFGEIICSGSIYLNGTELVATEDWVQSLLDPIYKGTVHSFNGKTGVVFLDEIDILKGGGAPINSPHFHGYPKAPTPWNVWENSEIIPNTKWVQQAICANLTGGFIVQSFNGRTGAVTLTDADITAACTASGAQPQTVTPPTIDSSLAIANTQWVNEQISALGQFAPLNSPQFTGYPAGPTAPAGTNSGQLATTAFVMAAVAASTTGVATWNGRTGNVTLTTADLTAAGAAPLLSPVFSGNPTAPTPPLNDNDTSIATTAFVQAAIAAIPAAVSSFNSRTGAVLLTTADIVAAGGAPLASPGLSGVPTAPTAATATSTTQLATTAFVHAAITASAGAVASFNGRTGAVTLLSSDISAASGALLASPAFTGTPTSTTAAPGTSTAQIATTAFVQAAISAGTAGVTSFNTRTGAITLNLTDVTAAGAAPLNNPTFTGTPAGPTAAPGVNTTQLATTAFVQAALVAAGGVSSFNGRSGAITLTGADLSAAGGALLASPTFTGIPSGPTAAANTNTTQLATTAFVMAAISAAGGVTSFNSRLGAVVFTAADLTGVGGALLASPTFTGAPAAPTAAPGTNTTQIASTAFVTAALTAAGGVSSFNSRTGSVVLTSGDISTVGGALLASPVFTGTPAAPTATAGTSTTQVATTAFVAAAVASIGTGVTSWNTRTGAVTLTLADVTGVGGAPLASPTFTGTPAAPTAAAGTNTTQLATTAFVQANGSLLNVQTFKTAGTASYVPTSGMGHCIVEVVGGGGGGGSAAANGTSAAIGCGGGAGGYSRSYLSAAAIGASQTVTVGAAGIAGVSGGNGGAGGNSSLGTLVIANGGGGGAASGSATPPGSAAGGAPGTGDITAAGAPGGPAFYNGTPTSVWTMAGWGGSSYFGGGAASVTFVSASNVTGGAGRAYGGGGAGGGNFSNATNPTGGAGAPGIVIITEYR